MEPPPRYNDWENDLKPREIKAEEWEIYKEQIKELYLTDGLALKDVRRLLFARHGFYATETQYKKRLSAVWKVQKNIPKQNMSAIIQIEDQRQCVEGKQTSFSWHGKLINKEKIDRSRKRLVLAEGNYGFRPDTPSPVEYWTPNPSPVYIGKCSEEASTSQVEGFSQWLDLRLESPGSFGPDTATTFSKESPEPLANYRDQHYLEMSTSVSSEGPFSRAPILDSSFPLQLMQEEPMCLDTLDQVLDNNNYILLDAKARNSPFAMPHHSGYEQLPVQYMIGHLCFAEGSYGEALGYYERAITEATAPGGWHDADILHFRHCIGLARYQLEHYETAGECFLQALQGREITLGVDDPATLDSLHRLGLARYKQALYLQSETCFRNEVEGRMKALRKINPAATTHNWGLGYNLLDQGILENALRWRARVLGIFNPTTLQTLHDLGLTYRKTQTYDEALKLLESAMDWRVKTLDKVHHRNSPVVFAR